MPLASRSWLAEPAFVGQEEVGFRACGWGGSVPPAGAEGGREVVPGWAQRVWRPGAEKQTQGSVGVRGEVWAVGVHECNGLGSLSWAPACRWRRLTLGLTQRSYPRLWRKGDQAKLRESIARVVAWVVQVRLKPELGAQPPEGKGGVRRTPDPKFSLGSQDILLSFCWSSAPRTRQALVDAWYPILG